MNEQEVIVKKIIPFLRKLEYSHANIQLEKPISIGRKTKAFADICVYLDEGDDIAFVMEAKRAGEDIDVYKDQARSYGLLLNAPYSVLSNGSDITVMETHTGYDRFSGKLAKSESLRALEEIVGKTWLQENPKKVGIIAQETIDEAQRLLAELTEEENFIKLLDVCENIIRDEDGLTGQDSFRELSKVLFVKIFSETSEEYVRMFDSDAGIDFLFDRAARDHAEVFERGEKVALSSGCKARLAAELSGVSFTKTNIDIKGKAFETFIGNTLTGKLGQFFTPRTVVEFMVDFLPPSLEIDNRKSKFIDPSCGSGGFLIRLLEKLGEDISHNVPVEEQEQVRSELVDGQIFGIDIDPSLVRTTKMNMVLHGDGKGGVIRESGLDVIHKSNPDYAEKFDFIYTNPPFGNKDELSDQKKHYTGVLTKGVHKSAKSTINREILFIEQYKNLLADGGYIAVVLPNGILNNPSEQYVRDYILQHFSLIAVIGLPDRTFKSSGANSHTSIVFMQKGVHRHSNVFMSVANEIGFERKTKFAKSSDSNDLSQILKNYKLFIEGGETNKLERFGDRCWGLPTSELDTSRLDANYYYAKHMVRVVRPLLLSDICEVVEKRVRKQDYLYRYVQYSDISISLGNIVTHSEGYIAHLPGRAKIVVKSGEVIAARLFDSEKNIAIVSDAYDGQLVSNGFIALRPKGVTPEVLFHLLKQPSTQEQIRFFSSGTILPACRDPFYLQIRVPELGIDVQEQAAEYVKTANMHIDAARDCMNSLQLLADEQEI